MGWLWREALPLGDACRAVEIWEKAGGERRSRGSGLGRKAVLLRNEKREGEWEIEREMKMKGEREKEREKEREVLLRLQACVEAAKREAAERGGSGQREVSWWSRWFGGRGKVNHDRRDVEMVLELVERWEGEFGGYAERVKDGVRREGAELAGEVGCRRAKVGGEHGGAERAGAGSEQREGGRAFSDARLGELAAGAKRAADALEGRALLRGEAHDLLLGAGVPAAGASWSAMLQLAALLGRVRLGGSVAAYGRRADARGRRRRERRCLRCGSGEALLARTACAACGRVCAYCTACIGMGRSRECELLVTGQRAVGVGMGGRSLAPIERRLAAWKLSPAQTAAAGKALRFVEKGLAKPGQRLSAEGNDVKLGKHLSASEVEAKPGQHPSADGSKAEIRNFLLWAVTGAGKTEMIFPLVESVLLRGGRALIATPRRDVVTELDPRIRRAFPKAAVVTLYGGSEQRWENGDITLATTHQLLRFYQGFDLVIVDEIDAYPYHGDPILHFAADKSCAPGAPRLLLSATPPSELQRDARHGRLPHARVPVRYHRHPLPVPAWIQTPAVHQMLKRRKLPGKLLAALRQSLERGAQLFVFVQRIAQTEPMAELLRAVLRHSDVAATSSQDAERSDKVHRFRSREIRVLVTTTILERGVTIPMSDVYILDADGKLFDEASLVQMAGRAGRSGDDPFGRVYFCSRERNRPQTAAVRHIRTMNKMARKQGFLHPKGQGGSPR
ncbi:DEAD/DEAH box helicase [Paenibacillus sp. N4]|nr:DEAD/DEAH box helicase [Paenibacillus vietnamensis]